VNLNRRIETLEKQTSSGSQNYHIIIPKDGETPEQARQRYCIEKNVTEAELEVSRVFQVVIYRMTRKQKSAKKRNPNQVIGDFKPNEDKVVGVARTVLRPTVQAAVTLKDYGKSWGDLDLIGLIDSLAEQTKASNDGDLSRAEAMLTTQAHTLDAIFNNLASRAIKAEYMNNLDTYLKMLPGKRWWQLRTHRSWVMLGRRTLPTGRNR